MKKVTIRRFPSLDYATEEAINTLCTNLSFSGSSVRSIMLTSTHATEGKSFLAMNVMRTLAKLGKTVVLVDADLRRSMIGSRFGVQFAPGDKAVGLSHFLAGMADISDVIYRTDIEGAFIVPVGKEVANSLQLLSTPRFSALITGLNKIVDYVLVDAPPIGVIIDAAEISKSCDGTLLVVRYNEVHRRELAEAQRQLVTAGANILGVALNMVEPDNFMNRNYYYKSYYTSYGVQSSGKSKGD